MSGWERARVNEGYKMTKVVGDAIAVRELNIFEKVFYWIFS
jgi:hypothetical protein